MRRDIFTKSILFLFTILLFSCNNILDKMNVEKEIVSSENMGFLSVSVKSSSERTIFVDKPDFDKMKYELVCNEIPNQQDFSGNNGNNVERESFVYQYDSYDKLKEAEVHLKEGRWDVVLWLIDEPNKTKFQIHTDLITIEAGKTSKVIFDFANAHAMAYSETDNSYMFTYKGNANVTLYFPADENVKTIKAGLFYTTGVSYDDFELRELEIKDAEPNSNEELAGKKYVVYDATEITENTYWLKFKMYDDENEEIKPCYSELIRIKAGRTSTAIRIINEIDVTKRMPQPSGTITLDGYNTYDIALFSSDGRELAKSTSGAYKVAPMQKIKVSLVDPTTRNEVDDISGWVDESTITLYQNGEEIDSVSAPQQGETIDPIAELTVPYDAVGSGYSVRVTATISGVAYDQVFPIEITDEAVIPAADVIAYIGEDNPNGLSGKLSFKVRGNSSTMAGSSYNPSPLGEALKKLTDAEITLTISEMSKIPNNAFYNCENIKNVIISDDVTAIGENAFYSCDNIESITFGDNVATIGESTFYWCEEIKEIHVSSLERWFSISFASDDSNPMTYSSDAKLYAGNDVVTDVVVPNGVTSINEYAFYGYSLTSITIPDSVTAIEKEAFRNCSDLVRVTIGDGVETIGYRAFYDCYSLKSVVIGNGVVTISEKAFYGCSSLSNLTMGNSVETIGSRAFQNCRMTSVTITENVSEISEDAFDGCAALENFVVEAGNDNFASYDGVLFNNDKTELRLYPLNKAGSSYTIPDGVITVGGYAFNNNETLESITIPSGVEVIGERAFNGVNITSIALPDTLKTIGESAFGSCRNLTSITIPRSVETLGASAFWNCTRLTDVFFEENTNLRIIPSNAFDRCTAIESVTIPEGVKTIQEGAFIGCTGIKTVVFPSTLSYIGKYAFSRYTTSNATLENVTFGVKTGWFYYENGMTTVKESDLDGNCATYYNAHSVGYWNRPSGN